MNRQAVDLQGQDAAGLDMFVGSGIDFLSEVTMEDMERELFNPTSSLQGHLSPQNFMNYAPLAASLGPPGIAPGLEPRIGIPALSQSGWRQFEAAEDQGQAFNFAVGASYCTPPQASGNPLIAHLRADSGAYSSGHLGTSGESQDPSEGGAAPAETSDAKAKLRDKNKRAQKRFRERKKEKAQETEKFMADLVAEIEQVKLEKGKLEERNQLLEKVLALNKQDAPLPTKGLLELTPDTLRANPTPFDAGFQEFDPDKSLPVSVLRSEPKSMKVCDVKNMSWEQHIVIWKVCQELDLATSQLDYVSKLAVLLVSAKGDPDSEAGAEVQETIQEAITLCSCKAMHDPYGVQHFYLARMEEGRRLSKQKTPQPEAMADMMANVLKSLRLREQQKRELMQLRRWVLPRVGQLMKERERISKALQACTQDANSQEMTMNSKNLSQAHVQAADILTELYSNLKEDQILLFQMSSAIWRKMMTPFQLANIVVQTFPWVPDTGALLNILAAQEDEPSAIELLGFTEGNSADHAAATAL